MNQVDARKKEGRKSAIIVKCLKTWLTSKTVFSTRRAADIASCGRESRSLLQSSLP